jgi:hypothetical protein
MCKSLYQLLTVAIERAHSPGDRYSVKHMSLIPYMIELQKKSFAEMQKMVKS